MVCLAIYLSGEMVLPPESTYPGIAMFEDEGTYRLALNYRIGKLATEEQWAYSNAFNIK
jgi:hypothetical protein